MYSLSPSSTPQGKITKNCYRKYEPEPQGKFPIQYVLPEHVGVVISFVLLIPVGVAALIKWRLVKKKQKVTVGKEEDDVMPPIQKKLNLERNKTKGKDDKTMITDTSEIFSVSLRPITSNTVRAICHLKVSENQSKLVTANAISLAEAYFYKNAWFRAVYAGETPVGFIMLHQVPKYGKYYLWRFMIDAKYQGRGYGRKALEMVIKRVKKNPKAKALTLSLVRIEGSAEAFYRKFGFEFTGKIEHGQHGMKLSLNQ